MSNHPLEGHEFRDLDAERKRMAALLREKGPEHVRTLRSEAREQLSALEKQLVKTQEKVEKKVLHITEKYGPEAGEEEREDAAWRVARGHGSDLFAEAVERLKAQAEEATNPRWRAVYVGRYRHITRLIRDLYRRQEWHEDLKFRLWAVQHVLRAWAVGELEEETQRGGSAASIRATVMLSGSVLTSSGPQVFRMPMPLRWSVAWMELISTRWNSTGGRTTRATGR